MDSIIVASPTAAESSLHFGPLAGPGFYSMLKESVDRFLVEVQRETCDFAAFRSIFFRLLQSSVDPPLEVIWFYSALGYHEAIRLKRDALDRVSAVRDLLQLLSACSASCDGPKSVALLAPVVSELYHCVKEEKKMSGKVAKKLRKEIEGLAEALVSYISICSGQSSDGKELSYGYLQPCFVDVIRVWTVQHLGRGDGLSVLFPLVTDEIRVCFEQERCGIDYLAGVVVVEALLLSLSLKVQMDGSPRLDLQKELRLWAVSSISVFQNCVSFDLLLRLLLNLPMPIMTILSSTEESWLRNILYDAVILADYSFLNPGFEVERFSDSMMNLVVRRLIVTHEAIRIVRDKGDHSKAISYTNAFSTSCVPGSLIKWANYQVGLGKLNRPNATTPQALLKWLMVLEEQGLKLFDDNISELHSKLAIKEYNGMPETTKFDSGSNSTDGDTFFFDNTGNVDENAADDDRDMEITDAAFLSAARSMKSEASKGRRKRKEWGYKGDESQVKFVKYKIHDNSVKEHLNTQAVDRMSSDSETENPPSPDEMEE
ncbi:hypothetical protein OPV22_028001 [Ensete ventricosum]|uniref:Uncharacterized protein n=1 Tax=Ensete ventricosum TaxID=4639 RepID=A0AAV8Q1U6_ENSVE|nr:hypothetical protein OPV22_028001 [Ensete ventricosum]